jgi:hypothetical protein
VHGLHIRKGEELTYQIVDSSGLFIDSIEWCPHGFIARNASEFERHGKSRQRRPEFMGDIAKE